MVKRIKMMRMEWCQESSLIYFHRIFKKTISFSMNDSYDELSCVRNEFNNDETKYTSMKLV